MRAAKKRFLRDRNRRNNNQTFDDLSTSTKFNKKDVS